MSKSPKKAKLEVEGALGKKILVLDCRKRGKPEAFLITVNEGTPVHMRRQLLKEKNKFESVVLGDLLSGSLQGLVDEESESADEQAGEVCEWLEENMLSCNRADFPLANPIDYYISIVEE